MFMYAYVGCRVTSFGTYVVRSKEYVSVLVAGESWAVGMAADTVMSLN